MIYVIHTLQVHYTARFADGIVFDSSYKRGRPLTMRIGVGKVNKIGFPHCLNCFVLLHTFAELALIRRVNGVQVIRGLDQGILGGEGVPPMRIGIKFNLGFLDYGTCMSLANLICHFYPGGKRKLTIPPLLAYGAEPAGCFSGSI